MTQQNWMMGIHHDGSEAYVSNVLPEIDETITIQLRTPKENNIRHIYMRSVHDGEHHLEKMTITKEDELCTWWSADLNISMLRMTYRFKILTDEGAWYYNALGVSRADTPDWYDFKILANYHVPEWVRETVFYQIFPDRFYNGDPSNDVQAGQWEQEGHATIQRKWGDEPYPWKDSKSMDFFGGDLQGITQKIEYLQSLGVNAIYLNPIFDAGTNHFYDVLNFWKIAPHLGGEDGLQELSQALHDAGMYLILDITPNHLSFRHEWVEEAKANPESPVVGYFSYNEQGELETWLGVPLLIKLNYTNQQLRDVMYRNHDSALRYWLKEPYNIDGWRLDVANMMGNLGINQQGNEISQEMRVAIKQDNPDAYILGEHFHDATTYLQGDQFDAAMNYQGFNIPMRRWLGGKDLGVDEWMSHDHGDTTLMASEAVAEQWQRYLASIPFVIAQQQFNQLSNHDITRLLDVVAQNKSLAKLGTAILLTFIGVPSLYYGDEIGLDGWVDPHNRKCMPWDEGEWDRELFEFHQKLIQIRHNSHALKYGGFQTLYAAGDTLAFMRESSQERVIIVGYRGEAITDLSIPVWQGGIADKTTFTEQLHDTLYTVQDKHLTFHAVQQGDALILVE